MKKEISKTDKTKVINCEVRFFVDERNGCVAIRDRELIDLNDNGCDADKIDVVKFVMGDRIDKGKFITWNIDSKIVQKVRIECALLNKVEQGNTNH